MCPSRATKRSASMTNTRTPRWLPALGAAALALSVAACDQRDDERTIGQRIDGSVAQTERKSEQMKDDIKVAANETSNKVKDASITTAVNAQLARDDKLSAIKIDVDTQDGRVRLNGSAPDAASRERATSLARSVDGVVSVDNQLTVAPPR
jgi:hyperosmotically inducible protein